MRPLPDMASTDVDAVIAFLSNPAAGGRAGGRGARGGRGGGAGGETYPPGPVVASGGVPLPALPARSSGPAFDSKGRGGPTGGNTAYPDGSEAPALRFATGYNVMATYTKPPYTTLTAYDLNTGEIKWQVANGDDPQTLARGGPGGTGGVGARHGMVVVKGGVVFLAGGDSKFRAYDEDTGKVLWTETVSGSIPIGVPAGYESKGRQYVVIMTSGGGGRGGGGGGARGAVPAPEPAATTPRGAIAFALPVK
jgi:quinoprotein glucose dehydrogenase